MKRLQQIWRHLWRGEREMRRAFGAAVRERIATAVEAAERQHRGELRVLVQGGLGWRALGAVPDSRALALAHFARQGVWDTAENAGVLVYVLLAEHRVEIVADRGIAARVPQTEWDAIVARALPLFAAGDAPAGLLRLLSEVGDLLATHFPARGEHPNELPDAPILL
ncbi:MAG: TPM domain-containing protein [Candidatus Dactylopiibacterium sp.]|nr:TPM domain-containing protein [Candidatus Dactylopiibacterium sp.]